MVSSNGSNAADFIYNGEQIFTIEVTNAQPNDSTELAGWFITYLKVSKYNDVQEIMELYIVNNCIRLYKYNTNII